MNKYLSNLLVTLLAMLSCSLPTLAAETPVTNFKNGSAIVIDVREEAEIKAPQGFVEGSKWLAISEINSDSPQAQNFIKSIDKSKLVYVYCASGGRSGKFSEKLKKLGFKAENIGGIADVTKAGFPIVRPK